MHSVPKRLKNRINSCFDQLWNKVGEPPKKIVFQHTGCRNPFPFWCSDTIIHVSRGHKVERDRKVGYNETEIKWDKQAIVRVQRRLQSFHWVGL